MKHVLVACWCVALCLGLLLYSLPHKPAPVDEAPIAIAPATTQPTTQPEPEPTRLYISVTDLDQHATWELLAQEFSQQTGIDVQTTDQIPTSGDAVIFTASAGQVAEMSDTLLDLGNTAAYASLASEAFAVTQEERIVALAADMAIFGLIYNETLLAQAGYTRSDVDSFPDLKAVAEQITANAKELGFGAFATPKANLTQLLASYPADCRGIWDLYRANLVDGSLTDGNAVFWLGSNLDFEELSLDPQLKLGMLPLYVGTEQEENNTFCAVSTRFWCVRAGTDASNQAAVAFLNFLVSPRIDGSVPSDDLQLLAPYRQASFGDNAAEVLLRNDIAAGKQCQICVNPTVPDGLMEALAVYGADPTDENWAAVSQLLNDT